MSWRKAASILLAALLLCLCGASAYAAEDEDGGIASLRDLSGAIEGTAVVHTYTAQRDIIASVAAANGSTEEQSNLSALRAEECKATLGSFSVTAAPETGLTLIVELNVPQDCIGSYLDLLHGARVERSLRITDGTLRLSVTGTGVYTLAVSDGRLMQRISPVTGQDALPYLLAAAALLSTAGAVLAWKKTRFT